MEECGELNELLALKRSKAETYLNELLEFKQEKQKQESKSEADASKLS